MAAVTLPTHYRNVFAELGYAQAEIDARRYYDNCLYFFALLALSGLVAKVSREDHELRK